MPWKIAGFFRCSSYSGPVEHERYKNVKYHLIRVDEMILRILTREDICIKTMTRIEESI
jgi:hypothetical protein